MKTKDEQNKMKMEYKQLNKKLKELSDEELDQVTECQNGREMTFGDDKYL